MRAFKHHIAKDFIDGLSPASPNGAGIGGTIFLDYQKMIDYLKWDGRDWWIAEIEVQEFEISRDFGNDYMATILVNRLSKDGYKPIK